MLAQMLERIVDSSLVHAGVARGMVFVAIAVIVWAVFERLVRSAVGAVRKRCPGCQYSLAGLPVRDGRLVCPECGEQFDERHTEFFKLLQWNPRWRGVALGVLMLIAASFSWWWFSRPAPLPAQPKTQAQIPGQQQLIGHQFAGPPQWQLGGSN